MPCELYYAPVNEASTVSLDELIRHLSDAGLPCKLRPEAENTSWVVLEGHESALRASVKENHLFLGALQPSRRDDSSVVAKLDAVLREAGYSTGEDSEYERW
jgi:hypothetical protein